MFILLALMLLYYLLYHYCITNTTVWLHANCLLRTVQTHAGDGSNNTAVQIIQVQHFRTLPGPA